MIIIKVFNVAIFLPMVVYSAPPLSETFRTEYVCDVGYGQLLDTGVERSILTCGGKCSHTIGCQSFVYNKQDKMCLLNSQLLASPSYNCPIFVKYGYFSNHTLTTQTTPMNRRVGESCLVTSDCLDAFSECINGVCQCAPTYVFDYTNLTCIFIMDCPAHGNTFKTSIETEFRDVENTYLGNVTENECRAICLTATQYTCRLFEFSYKRYTCRIFSLELTPAVEIINTYDPEADTFVYERECSFPVQTMYTSCLANRDCAEPYSECYQGTCLCRVGLSYDLEQRKCVSECFLFSKPIDGQPYQKRHNTFISNYTFSSAYSVQSGSDCVAKCAFDASINCVSLMADMTSSTCYLSEQTLGIYPPESFTPSFAHTVVQLDCEPMTSQIEFTPCYGTVCSADNSECRDGVCKCVQGFRYHSTLDQCSDICMMYGNTFQNIVGLFVDKHNDINLIMTSNDVINECKAACVQEKSIICVMAEINLMTNVCTLSSSVFSQILSTYFLNSVDYITLIRDCS